MGLAEWSSDWANVRTRGEIKRIGKRIDETPEEKQAIIEALKSRGWGVEADESGKKLLRMWLDRSADAQVRQNPIHLNETFECIFCQQEIPLPDAGIRDHCPRCLRGRHVDNIPGDRAAECRGRLEPIEFSLEGGVVWIRYACVDCTHRFRVRAHAEDALPSSLSIADLPKGPKSI